MNNQSSPYCPSCQCPNCSQLRASQQRRCPSCQQPLTNSQDWHLGQYNQVQGQNAGQGGQGQQAQYCVGCWRNLSTGNHSSFCRYRP